MPYSSREHVLAYIDDQQTNLVSFCQKLLQTPSVNGEHPELAVAEVIRDEAQRLGLASEMLSMVDKRPNIVVTVGEGTPGLLLVGHLDTVSVGDADSWTYPPFAGQIVENRLYGRGAIDTKGGIAAALYTLAALKHTSQALQHTQISLVCVPDEESGATGRLGIQYLDAQGKLAGRGAIYVYSGTEYMRLGHRGVLRVRIIVHGEATHTGGRSWQNHEAGANAVSGMAEIITALEKINYPLSQEKYFENYKTVITPGTVISGGTGVSIVPARCEALVDIRLVPDQTKGDILIRIEETIVSVLQTRPKLDTEIKIEADIPAVASDDNAAIFQALADATETILSTRPQFRVSGPANEGYLLIERGIPTVCGFGPQGENAHGIDEYVEIDSLSQAAKIYALTAVDLEQVLS